MIRAGRSIFKNLAYRSGATRAAVPALMGTAVVGGGIAGVLDKQGPYPQIAEDLFGDHRTFNAAAKAAITQGFSNTENVAGTSDYYYGGAADPTRQRVAPSGDVVFGMWNLRR